MSDRGGTRRLLPFRTLPPARGRSPRSLASRAPCATLHAHHASLMHSAPRPAGVRPSPRADRLGRSCVGAGYPGRSTPGWRLRLVMAAGLLAGAVLAGCATTARPPADPSAVRADQDELESLFWQRIRDSRALFVEADVRFMTGMIAHHGQALVMAALVPDRAADPSLRILAERIRVSQEDEIALMQRWLRDRGQAVPELHIDGTTLMVHGTHHGHEHSGMPGMLTDAQLDELEQASGAEFDRLFLERMIEHHRGAVTMVGELLASDGAARDPDLFRFASDVQVDQTTEVARMERMLQEMALRVGNP